MSHELYYTSVPPGLIPGVKGYSTVARTAEIPARIVLLLEQSLSDYRYSPEGNPPVVWTHLRVREGLRELSVLSRKTPVPDHSGRPSVFAHHMVLGPDEQPDGGPAWVLAQGQREAGARDLLLPAWDRQTGTLPAGRQPRNGDRPPGRCTAWEAQGLDPGWAGVLAEAFLAAPDHPAFLICRPDRNLLLLFEDAIALLPVARRWSLTFSTYFTGLPPNVPCAWRGVLAGSAEARQAVRLGRGLIIDLDAPGEPQGDSLVELARTGVGSTRTVVRPQPASGPARWVPSSKLSLPTVEENPTHVAGPAIPVRTRRKQSGPSMPMIAGAAASVLLLVGVTVYLATQEDPRVVPPEAPPIQQARPAPEAPIAQAEPPPQPVAPPTSPPAKPAVPEKPKEVVKQEPIPEPAVKETRFANCSLPDASTVSSRHDDGDTTLGVDVPPAPRYTLSLRGLNDREIQRSQLVARPTKSGLTADVTVFNETVKPGANKLKEQEAHELARFWIDRDRLHFRWVANKLERYQEEAAAALRECLLIIRGGTVRTQLALRDMVVQPEPITVQKGNVSIRWKEQLGRPARRVEVLSCQVQQDGKWCDLAEAHERNEREWTILGPTKDEVEPRLVLRVRLATDDTELIPSLDPSLRHIERTVRGLTSRRRDHANQVKGLRTLHSGSDAELAMMEAALPVANAALHIAEANLEATKASVRQFYSEFMPIDNVPDVMRARHALEKARIDRDRLELEIRDYSRKIPELRRNSGDASSVLKGVEETIAAERELQKEAERASQRPIRVKLGIVIDAESMEVARIGPW
jgi:outer membrane biosynthesis protein TonB